MKFFYTLIFALISTTILSQNTYLHCGKLIDTKTGTILTEKTVVVSGNKIIKVESGYLDGNPDDITINLKNKTVMPGLIDMHVHLEQETNPNAYLEKYTASEADVAYNSVGFAEATLLAGFTTVRDLGGSGVNISLKKAINKGRIDGPRIFTAGKSLATTGGHADPTNGNKRSEIGDPGPKDGVVNSIEDAKKAVRQRYKNGADLIKITATGGVLSVAKSSSNPQFTVEEIKEITKTAKDYGFHVAAHAHGDEGMQRAILGGVKTIEHGTLMSTKTMDLMKKYKAYLVPTITAGKEVTEKAAIDGYYPAIIVPKALEIGPQIQNTFSKAFKRGVRIAFGTDAGVFKHGQNAKEFAYMVEAGMPAMTTIQCATIVNAKILNMRTQLGQIAPDFFADIVAVNEDPTKDISTMENVVFVMKDGKVFKQ
ncbi:amidohydrolase family protein [Aquimarina sp. RZ0]|uniref:metal-dependent hydrolase family protein n=1 Tax=Aquimarina sp. RZ0 TaxID=2607730 RepID=UPI0011F3550B|nr:amidohydrolase family protein [Aquimarina sp. RZ0]KAA1244564.1 amidohydrolase family protein [Aquimarina sp. RZ0]